MSRGILEGRTSELTRLWLVRSGALHGRERRKRQTCESFGDGPWTMRIEDRNGMLHFLAGPQGDTPSDLFPEGLAGGGLPVHAQVWLLAPAVDDTALASVQALTWSRCGE